MELRGKHVLILGLGESGLASARWCVRNGARLRLADTRTRHLRDVAARMKLGGVGYYASSNFVHLDVGRPRQW